MNSSYSVSRYLSAALLAVMMQQHGVPPPEQQQGENPPEGRQFVTRSHSYGYAAQTVIFQGLLETPGPGPFSPTTVQLRIPPNPRSYVWISSNPALVGFALDPDAGGVFGAALQYQNQKALFRNDSILRTQGVPPPEFEPEAGTFNTSLRYQFQKSIHPNRSVIQTQGVPPPDFEPEAGTFGPQFSHHIQPRFKSTVRISQGVPPADVAPAADEILTSRRVEVIPRVPYDYVSFAQPSILTETDELLRSRRAIVVPPVRPYRIAKATTAKAPVADIVVDELLQSRRTVFNPPVSYLAQSVVHQGLLEVSAGGPFSPALASLRMPANPRSYVWTAAVPPADAPPATTDELQTSRRVELSPRVPYRYTTVLEPGIQEEIDELDRGRRSVLVPAVRRYVSFSFASTTVPPADVVAPEDELLRSRRAISLGKPEPLRQSRAVFRQPEEIDELLAARRTEVLTALPYKTHAWVQNAPPADVVLPTDELLSSRRVIVPGRPEPLRPSVVITRQPTEIDELLAARRVVVLPAAPYKRHVWTQVATPADIVLPTDELLSSRRVVVPGKAEPIRRSIVVTQQPTEIDELLPDRRVEVQYSRPYGKHIWTQNFPSVILSQDDELLPSRRSITNGKPEPLRKSIVVFQQPDEIDELLVGRRFVAPPNYPANLSQFITNAGPPEQPLHDELIPNRRITTPVGLNPQLSAFWFNGVPVDDLTVPGVLEIFCAAPDDRVYVVPSDDRVYIVPPPETC